MDWSLRRAVESQLEQIGPRVVADDVEAAARHADALEIDFGVEDAALLVQRPRDHFPAGRDDDRVAGIDPFLRVAEEFRHPWNGVADVARLECAAAARHPAAALARDV